MISKRSIVTGLAALGVVGALTTAGVVAAQAPAATPAQAAGPGYAGCPMTQGWGPGSWQGGPGMMQGWGGGPGMQGWGGGPGWGGHGPGMMQGWGGGPGWDGGPGMMQQRWQRGMTDGWGPGHHHRGWTDRDGVMPWAASGDTSVADVQKLMEWRVARMHNPNLKVGKVEVKDDKSIVADIVTAKENALVREFEVDRKTGQFKPLP